MPYGHGSDGFVRFQAHIGYRYNLRNVPELCSQAIAQEWEPFGIAVNCINPERTKTPMRVKNFGTEPENTLLSAEKVAIATIQSLVSEFTGQVIDVKRNEV